MWCLDRLARQWQRLMRINKPEISLDTLTPSFMLLFGEVKKDAIFFGLMGLIVGLIAIFQSPSSHPGAANLGTRLFSGFVPFDLFAFLFIVFVIVGGIYAAFRDWASSVSWISNGISHLELRIAQLISSIVCFTVGLAIVALAYSVVERTLQGVLFCCVLVIVDLVILFCYFLGSVAYRHLTGIPGGLISITAAVVLFALIFC